MGTPRWCATHSKRRRGMLIISSVFEQQPLQKPVKIAHSVYCAFDPVRNTPERQARWSRMDFIPTWEKLPYESFSDCRALPVKSACFVLPFDQLLCWNRLIRAEEGRVEERGQRTEAARKGLQRSYPLSMQNIRFELWHMSLTYREI